MQETTLMRKLKREGWVYRIHWHAGWQGYCEPEEKRISLNVLKIIASVVIHENCHAVDGNMSENEVLMYEEARRLVMTRTEAEAIVREFNPELFIAIANLTRR